MLVAGLLGLSGVILAAAGSHWLAQAITRPDLWQQAQFIHWAHVPCVLICALATGKLTTAQGFNSAPTIILAGWVMALGVLLFSGTLYLRASILPQTPVWLAPGGGLLLILGWLGVVYAAVRSRPS